MSVPAVEYYHQIKDKIERAKRLVYRLENYLEYMKQKEGEKLK